MIAQKLFPNIYTIYTAKRTTRPMRPLRLKIVVGFVAAENAKNTKDDSLETITKHLHVSTRSTRLKDYTLYASFAAKI